MTRREFIILEIDSGSSGMPLESLLDFVRLNRSALDLLHRSAGGKRALNWEVDNITKSNPIVAVIVCETDVPIAERYTSGIRQIVDQRTLPQFFDVDLLRTVKDITELISGSVKRAFAYTNPGDKTSLNGRLADRLNDLLEEEEAVVEPQHIAPSDIETILSKPSYGSVEGDFSGLMFESASANQLPYFSLHSEHGVIRCDYDPGKYSELSSHVPRDRESLPRLRVFGLISKKGRKISRIEVRALDWLVPPDHIPSFAEIAKLNLLGGMDSLEHVRRARDGE